MKKYITLLSFLVITTLHAREELQREVRAIPFHNQTNISIVISSYSENATEKHIIKAGFKGYVSLFTPMKYHLAAHELEHHVVSADLYIEAPQNALELKLKPNMHAKKLGIVVELDGKEIQR